MSRKVILANSESTKRKDKIPEYAEDFKKEWLYIRGINKKCGEILSKINFNSIKANNLNYHIKKFLKDQECGRLKDISGFYFKYFDVNNIDCLEEQLSEYPYHFLNRDCLEEQLSEYPYHFLNRDCFDSDQELLDFFELIKLINDKIEKESPNIIFKSDSESD